MIGMLVAVAVLMGVMAWLLVGSRGTSHEPTLDRRHDDGVDRAELEEAEREVRDAPDADSVRDWGPGAGKPRPPEML
jgi:hypothetical protein